MKNAQALYDLIQINIDRIAEYEKAAVQTVVEDVRSFFEMMAEQSNKFANELMKILRLEGDEPSEGKTLHGKIYKNWMDIKAIFNPLTKTKSLLSSCERGEVAAQNCYLVALKEDMPADIKDVIEYQKTNLREAYIKIKDLRNTYSS